MPGEQSSNVLVCRDPQTMQGVDDAGGRMFFIVESNLQEELRHFLSVHHFLLKFLLFLSEHGRIRPNSMQSYSGEMTEQKKEDNAMNISCQPLV